MSFLGKEICTDKLSKAHDIWVKGVYIASGNSEIPCDGHEAYQGP